MKKQMTKIAGLGLCIFLLLVMISTAYADELTGEVKTSFVLTPEDTLLEVYSKSGQGEKIMHLPEADGSFVLLPGRYYYTATAEGYYSLEETEFILSGEQNEIQLTLELQEIPIINSGTCGSGLTWKLDELGRLTITGNGRIRNYYSYNLPPWGTGVTKVLFSGNITGIGNYAFFDCDNLSNFTFPDSILSIGENAFTSCDALSEIAIPANVTSIGNSAFEQCQGLHSVDLDEREKALEIKNYAFTECDALTRISFPSQTDGLITLGEYAFAGCDMLQTIQIAGCVSEIGRYAFAECSRLSAVTMSESDHPLILQAYVFSDCPNLNHVIIPQNSISGYGAESIFINDSLLLTAGPVGSGSHIEFGWTEEIPEGFFRNNPQLISVIFPDTLKTVSAYAFSGCYNLTELELPLSLDIIGTEAFKDCTGIETVSVYGGMRYLAESAFNNCGRIQEIHYDGSETIRDGYMASSWTATGNEPFYDADWYFREPEENWEICGANASFRFDRETNQLHIKGNGEIWSIAWKHYNDQIETVQIEEGISNIPDMAFENCTNLTDIAISANLQTIGTNAFYGCSQLQEIVIPDSVTSIGESAFSGCSGVTNIEFSSGVTRIEAFTFADCSSLRNIEIPSGVTNIGSRTFYNCSQLQDIVIPDSVTSIGESAFSGCSGLTNIEIPSGVTRIEASTFENCSSLRNIEIRSGVTNIGPRTFYNCQKLVRVVLPDSIQNIGQGAFQNCLSISELSIGSIESWLAVISQSDSDNPLGHTGALSVNLYINGEEAKQVVIPEGITAIPAYAFYKCSNIQSVETPDSLISIGNNAFRSCSGLTSVQLSPEMTDIGDDTFYECISLKSIEIPNGITNIGYRTFYGCKNLVRIAIPNNLQSIGQEAFRKCESISELSIGSIESWLAVISQSDSCNPLRQTATSSVDLYINGDEADRLVIPEGITAIPAYAFYKCSNIQSVETPESLISIGKDAFSSCNGLTSVQLSSGLTSIGSGAFSSNHSLTDIDFPEGLIDIGDYSFSYCDSLTSIEIPMSVTSIGEFAFLGCVSLMDIKLTSGLTTIGRCIFSGCENLKSIIIPEGVTSIDEAFSGCSSLESVRLPDSVTSMNGAFGDCSSLESVRLPDSVTSMNGAFGGCSSLKRINIPFGVTSISSGTFTDCIALNRLVIPSSVTCIDNDAFSYSSAEMMTSGLSLVFLGDQPEDFDFWMTNVGAVFYPADRNWQLDSLIEEHWDISFTPYHELFTLQFDLMGGKMETENLMVADGESLDVNIAIPSREGYTFLGWTNSRESTDVVWGPDRAYGVEGDATLYAIWLASDFVVPAALKTIEEEAFEGGAFVYVKLAEGTESIQNRAFADCLNLRYIYIPEATESIHRNAFEGISELTVLGQRGSYAEYYAGSHGFGFIAVP